MDENFRNNQTSTSLPEGNIVVTEVVAVKPLPPASEYEGARAFALVGSLMMLVMSVWSFLAPGSVENLPPMNLTLSYGYFLDYFPMNVINKIALLLFALAGLACYKDAILAVMWCRSVFIVMGLGAILGLFPYTMSFFGYWPLWGGEVLAHAFFAIVGLYFGYRNRIPIPKILVARRKNKV